MASDAERVKERTDIVEVVTQYVKLQRAGKHFKGLSPFTKEKTPSFFVSPERQSYYCFSTNKGGDAFTFIQEMEGLDFRGALKLLADRAGIELSRAPQNAGEKDKKERLYEALEEACVFYQHAFATHKDAHAYLQKRGAEDKTIALFRIGFAPPEWEGLKTHLLQKKFTESELLDAGLIKKGERGTTYDRFRSRITFPIKDSVGRVVGFSARIFGEGDADAPKYLNSPEGILYDKSSILFNFDLAKQAIKKLDFVIFVEGQMDALMVFQAGFHNVVAVSGTALTPQHITHIERITKNVLLAFDSDRAGVASALRAAGLLFPRGIEVKVVSLGGDKDPADIIVHEGNDAWKALVRKSVHLIPWYLTLLEKNVSDERKRERAVRTQLLPLVAAMQSAMERAHFSKHIAGRLLLPEDAVNAEIALLVQSHTTQNTAAERIESSSYTRNQTTSAKKVEEEAVSRLAHLQRKLAGVSLLLEVQATDNTFEKEQAKIKELLAPEILQALQAERDQLLFETELTLADTNVQEYLEMLFRDVGREQAREAYRETLRALRRAEAQKDDAQIDTLLAELNKQKQRIASFG